MIRVEGIVPDRVKWRDEAAEARRSPGVWFALTERDTENGAWSFAHGIRGGRRKAFLPAESFEACARERTVMIRFIGDEAGQ